MRTIAILSLLFVALLVGCAQVAETEDVMEDKSGDAMEDKSGEAMEDTSEVTDENVDEVLSDISESDVLSDDLGVGEFDDFEDALSDLDSLDFE